MPLSEVAERSDIDSLVGFVSKSKQNGLYKGISKFETFALLFTYVMGANFLVQAYAFRESGIGAATAAYLTSGIATYYGCTYLLDSAITRSIFDIGGLADDMLGSWGYYLTHLSIATCNIGCQIEYIIMIVSIIQSLVSNLIESAWYISTPFLAGVVVAILTPFCLAKLVSHLTVIAYLACVFLTCVVLTVIFVAPLSGTANESDTLNYGSLSGLGSTLGYILLMYGFNVAILQLYATSEITSSFEFNNICLAIIVLGGAMCFVTGLSGYLAFRDSTTVNILDNFSGPVGITFKILAIFHLMCYFPGNFVISRHSIFKLCGVNVIKCSTLFVNSWTLVLLVAIGVAAAVLQIYLGTSTALSNVINISGGLCSTWTSFILPGMFAIIDSEGRFGDIVVGYGMILFGVLSSAVVIVGTIFG